MIAPVPAMRTPSARSGASFLPISGMEGGGPCLIDTQLYDGNVGTWINVAEHCPRAMIEPPGSIEDDQPSGGPRTFDNPERFRGPVWERHEDLPGREECVPTQEKCVFSTDLNRARKAAALELFVIPFTCLRT